MKTTALVFPRAEAVEIRELDLPDPTPRDIVVEVEASGVSVGTERWTYLGKRAELTFPNVPGYIAVGRISEAGEEARKRGYLPGGRVNFFRSRLAGEMNDTSWMASHLSRAVVDVTQGDRYDADTLDIPTVIPLPDGLDPVDAAGGTLGGVALRGIEMAVIPVGATVLVVGLGLIGQYAAQICRLKGARVAAADVVPSRLGKAKENGADWAINPKTEDLAARAREIAPKGFDVIIDTSSHPAVVDSLVPLLRFRGKFVFQGWYPPPSPLNLHEIQMRMATCFFPCAHNDAAVAAMMRWIHEGKIQARNLISHVVKPAQAPEIYKQIAAGSDGFLGVVFDWRG